MKVAVVYCWPPGDAHYQWGRRFLLTYRQFPAMAEHDLILLTDPGTNLTEIASIPNCSIFRSEAPGLDISRYQSFCAQSEHDMVFFCGGSTYCRYGGWLNLAVSAFDRLGRDNLYGAMGYTGSLAARLYPQIRFIQVAPHVRSTGFWCAPGLMNLYPGRVTRPNQRFPFEHGRNCFTGWVLAQGRRVYVVDGAGEHEYPNWNDSPQGYLKGEQKDLIIGDRRTEPSYYPFP